MSAADPNPAPDESAIREATGTVRRIEEALELGRRPRGGRPLRQAARTLQAAGMTAAAIGALRALSLLETRRGKYQHAIGPARAALRLASRHGDAVETGELLDLLAGLYTRLGDLKQAQAHALRWLKQARAGGDRAGVAGALARQALVARAGGDLGSALILAEEGREAAGGTNHESAAERLLCALLLQAGCPTAAEERLSRRLSAAADSGAPREEARVLLLRGWCRLAAGRAALAARDFRRARRLAAGASGDGTEAKSLASLSVAESRQAAAGGSAARAVAAFRRADRAARSARRHRDADLDRRLQTVLHEVHRVPDAGEDTKVAARTLVELATRVDSLLVVEACIREVERMSGLPPGQPAYAGTLSYPFEP